MQVTLEEVTGFSLTAMQWIFKRIPHLTTQDKVVLGKILQSLHIISDSDTYWFDGVIPGIKPGLVKELSLVSGNDIRLPQLFAEQQDNLTELDGIYKGIWQPSGNRQAKPGSQVRNPDREFDYVQVVIEHLRLVPVPELSKWQPEPVADFSKVAAPVRVSWTLMT